MIEFRLMPAWLLVVLLGLGLPGNAAAATHDNHAAAQASPVVIPVSEVIGGTGVANNAKKNPNGGYFSAFDSIAEFNYPATHGNQLGNTAMVNDHTYWDSSPGGLDATHAPKPDQGGGHALWWPAQNEWVSYDFNVAAPDTYAVMTRFSSSWGPDKPVVVQITIDGASSGPLTLKSDDPKIWNDRYYQVAGWWGHTMTNFTSPVGWALANGHHVMKVHIDSLPDNPNNHGGIWIHYFKIMKPAGEVPVVNRTPEAEKTVAQGAALEKLGKPGQAIALYEKAIASAKPKENVDALMARIAELKADAAERFAKAQALTGEAALAALTQLADEYAGSEAGAAAAKLLPALRLAAYKAKYGAKGFMPKDAAHSLQELKAWVCANAASGTVRGQLTLFSKKQYVTITGGDDRGLTVNMGEAGTVQVDWSQLPPESIAKLAVSCVKNDGAKALACADLCLGAGLRGQAKRALDQALQLDPTQAASISQRLEYLETLPETAGNGSADR